MGGKGSMRKAPPVWLSAALLAVWFGSSVCSTLVNKDLMDKFPYAVTLSAVHLLSSAVVDLAIVWYRGLNTTFRKDVLISCLPVALTINFGKVLTYVSYGMVPASLTHTAKASSPVFSVIVSKVLFNQVPSLMTGLSLVPITVGVTLSALTELNWVFLGFLAAVCAAFASVLNSTYTKKALHSPTAPDPLIFHMYTACTAVALLLPWVILVELPNISMFGGSDSGLVVLDAGTGDGASPPPPLLLHPLHHFPYRSMLLSLMLHYAQNISNIYYLRGVSVLTHQVAQSLKRLLNITGAVIYFGNKVTPMNVLGMALALLGFSMYSYAKQAPMGKKARSNSGATGLSGPSSPISPAANGTRSTGYITPITVMVEGGGASNANGNGNGSGGGVALGPHGHIEMWGGVKRSESTESFHSSTSPDHPFAQQALHPTAHAQVLAAQAHMQQQAQLSQLVLHSPITVGGGGLSVTMHKFGQSPIVERSRTPHSHEEDSFMV